MIDFEKYGLVTFSVPYEDVINCNIKTVFEALDSLLESRASVIASRGKIALSFDGYENDPRDVWYIPEVRRYVAALDAAFPYWFYFLNLEMPTLKVLCLCLCAVVKASGGVKPNTADLKLFFYDHFAAVNRLCETFRLGEATRTSITKEILEYLVPSK
jgi:hypothetical protein